MPSSAERIAAILPTAGITAEVLPTVIPSGYPNDSDRALMGCSLADTGTVVGDTIECQCHGSRFDLRTGRVARGPATFDQPAYDVRRAEGRVEVRRMRR